MDNHDQEVCKPIVNLSELKEFLEKPPVWSSLVNPRSKRSRVVRNSDLYEKGNICHFAKSEQTEITQPLRYEHGFLPKTLVCHDMMNGYHDDRHINGTDNFAAYTFYNWSAIDMFVYFSHHFITIPPLGWINAAHKHGVQVLGTIITEWDDGFKICQEFLQSEDSMNTFVRNLVTVAKHLKFDGWLINIENKIENVDMLLKFVKSLTDCMHSEIVDSTVIWYDSVTNKGALAWQDCLNDLNKDYFDVCDGIFTNYCWTESQLQKNVENSGRRKVDVFVGVDVWGRNFWGGGCLNTAEAVKVIHKYGLSLAIFAPAWTHEAIKHRELMEQQDIVQNYEKDDSCFSKLHKEMENEPSDYVKNQFFMKCAVKENFILRETAFWNTIWPYLNTRGPSQLPFQTFFCLGSGNKRRIDGEVTHEELWFNLNEQEYQISIPFCSNSFLLEKIETTKPKDVPQEVKPANSTGTETKDTPASPKSKKPPIIKYNVKPNTSEAKCISPYTDESYNGGNCLKILPTTDQTNDAVKNNIIRIFLCEFLCDFNFIIYYIIKAENSNQDLDLFITLKENKTGNPFQAVLCTTANNDMYSRENVTTVNPLREVDYDKFKKLQMDLLNNHSQFYIPVNNDKDWIIRYFVLEHPNSSILEINCHLKDNIGYVLLGGLGITRDIPI